MHDSVELTRKGRAVLSPSFPAAPPCCHLVQSEWCMVPTPALYVSKRQGRQKSWDVITRSRPKEAQLKQTEQEKEHNPWLFGGGW